MGASGVAAQVRRAEGNTTDAINYLHADRLGSLDAVTDGSGNPVASESFRRDPYGNRVTNFNQPTLPDAVTVGSNKVHFGFTGQEQDDDLGLINMRGRMYDSRLGQFLSADPMVQAAFDGQSHNRFAFGNVRIGRDGSLDCDQKDCAVWGLTEEGAYVEFGHWGDKLILSSLPYSPLVFMNGVFIPYEMSPNFFTADGEHHQVLPERGLQGSIGQAIVETIATFGVMGVVRGGAAIAEEEVFYRAMSEADFELMLESGQLPATAETFISPTRAYAEMYDGILVEFRLEAGATEELAAIGVRDGALGTARAYPGMARVFEGWGDAGVAFFKTEGTRTLGVPQINIGLGRGAALNVFNSRMMRFDVVRP